MASAKWNASFPFSCEQFILSELGEYCGKIMRKAALFLALVAGLPLLDTSAVAAPPPAEAFGSLPGAEFARLSPDGKRLAVVKPINGHEKVAFFDLTKPDSVPYVVGMEGGLAGEVYWKSNDRAICVFHANFKHTRSKLQTWARALSVDVAAQTATLMMYNAPYFRTNFDVGSIADMAADDPNHVFMTEWDVWDREVMLDFYRVDLTTGAAALAMHGDLHTIGFLSDGYGHLLGQVQQDADLTNHVILGNKEVYKYQVSGASDFGIEGLTAGPNPQFAIEKPTPSGTTGLYMWSAAGFDQALFENPVYDVDDVIGDERTGRVIGVSYIDDMRRVKYLDPAMQHMQDSFEKAYPGQAVAILSKDDAGSSYVILTEGPKAPPALSLFTVANHQAYVIEQAYPSLKSADLGDVKPYPYKARDGLDIHAYLTLPVGRDPHNLPTVIFPHGGPEARDRLGFEWWAQFLASRGYAVLQPNFRGSSGYGWDFVKAGDGEWAKKVQFDVQDGVAKLIADGIADPKRICIVGASYGGYMALAGATFSPDLYACAVSYAGVSDWSRDLYTGTTFDSEVDTIWARRIGAGRSETGKLDEISPAKHADQVKIPVLLIHSDKDTTVKIEQSEIEEQALKHAGKQVEFVTLAGDDHYLEFGDTRIQMLKAIETFLAAHIGN